MPDEVTNELIYEVLKSVQAQVSLSREDVNNIKVRMTSVEQRLGLVHTDMSHQSDRLDRIDVRLDKIEKRLGLVDA